MAHVARPLLIAVYMMSTVTVIMTSTCPWDDTEDISPCWCAASPDSLQVLVNCSGTNLTDVPPNLPINTTVLDLSYNTLSPDRLASVCGYYNLETLILTRSEITYLPDKVFSRCIISNTVDLSGNVIRVVTAQILSSLDVRSILGLESLQFQADSFLSRRYLRELGILFHQQDIPDGLFSGLKLEVLNISMNRAIKLPPPVLQPLRSSLRELRIKGSYFQYVEYDLLAGFEHLQVFELDVEMLETFSMSVFESTSQLLTIVICGIKDVVIEETHLFSLDNLKELTIHRAKRLPIDLFTGFRNLSLVDLSESNIDTVPDQWFENDMNIDYLNLSQVGLKSLNTRDLDHLSKLRTLDVSRNSLRALADGLFHPISDSVLGIHLQGNLLTFLAGNIFMNCTHLEYLDLSDNQISWVGSEVFDRLESLHSLNLRDNKLSQLEAGIFLSTERLRHLDLSSNILPDIPLEELDNLWQLTSLDVSNNRIVSLPRSIPGFVPSLTGLDLRFNPINCNCDTVRTFTSFVTIRVLASCKRAFRDLDLQVFADQADCRKGDNSADDFGTSGQRSVTSTRVISVRYPDIIQTGSVYEESVHMQTSTYSPTPTADVTLYPSGVFPSKPGVPSNGKRSGNGRVPVQATPSFVLGGVNTNDVMADDERKLTKYNVTELMASSNVSDPASMVTSRSTVGEDTGNGFYTAVVLISTVAVICVLIVTFLFWRKRRRGERYEVSNNGFPDDTFMGALSDRALATPTPSIGVLKEVPSIQIEAVDDDDNVHVIQYSTSGNDVRQRPEIGPVL